MARPAKPIDMAVGARTKDEIESRKTAEQSLKSNKPTKPPRDLSKEQKKIFKDIAGKLEEADILCTLDDYILAKTAIAIDKLREIDSDINAMPELKYDQNVMNSRTKYTQDFYRGCNELGLSPQARAKMAISMSKQEEDPLSKLLAGDAE